MHPPAFEHARSLQTSSRATRPGPSRLGRWGRLAVLCAVGVLLGVLTGCEAATRSGRSPFLDAASTLPAPSAAERDSALAQLDRMNRAVFDSAFVRMERYAFTRSTRTEQLTPDGAVAALRRETVRVHPDSAARVVDADTVGTFGRTLFSGFASGDADPLPGPLGEYVLDDKPAYRSARSREAFEYRTRPDMLDGVPVTVVTVTARDTGEGAEQSIRRATLTLTRDGLDVVAMSTIRAERSILFTEDSRFVVRLRRAPDGTWVPALTRFDARVGVPFRDAQPFRTATAYTDYRRVRDAA